MFTECDTTVFIPGMILAEFCSACDNDVDELAVCPQCGVALCRENKCFQRHLDGHND